MTRPKDYVLIDGDTVYDVKHFGDGPHMYGCYHIPRPKPAPPRRTFTFHGWYFVALWIVVMTIKGMVS